MRIKPKKWIAAVLVLCMVLSWLPTTAVSAAEMEVASGTCGDDLTWELDENGILTISGTGEMDIGWWAPWENWSDSITSVVIEAGVSSIKTSAFHYLPNLTGIWVDADHPDYSSDDCGVLFNKDMTAFLLAPRGLTGAYVIPDGVTRIDSEAFLERKDLTDITIPDSICEIGNSAFRDCTGLTNITIPDSVTWMDMAAFSNCTGLTSVIMGSGIRELQPEVFANCTSLTELYFEGDAPGPFEEAFWNVTATVYYPAGNDTWTEDVMQNYGGELTWVSYEPEGETPGDDDGKTNDVIYDIPEDGSVVIPENDCFEPDTVVTAEKVEDGETYETASQVMDTVAEAYVVFEINATKDNVEVQPNGSLLVTFSIPEGFSDNIAVYYMSEDGSLELLTITMDAEKRTVSVELAHFSTYILVDMETQVEQVLMGDANGDGKINYLDAMLVAQYYVAKVSADQLDLSAADVNGDGVINYLDAMMIAQYYVG